MIPKEVAHGICLSQARSTGRKRRRRRRSVGSGLRGSSSSRSRAPWLSSTSSWRLNLSSASSHQGERKGLGKGSSTITDQNNTADRTFASLAEERESPDVYPMHNRSLRNVATTAPVHTNILCTIATQRCQPPPHEYSLASLTLKWGITAYCMRLPLLGERTRVEGKKRWDTW